MALTLICLPVLRVEASVAARTKRVKVDTPTLSPGAAS